jgi:hypothetical protein
MRRVAMFAVVLVALLAGACSSDSEQVQNQISDSIKSETGVTEAKVTCPSEIKATKGEKFKCTATGSFTDYVKKQGLDAKVENLTFDVEFVEDRKFSHALDVDALRAEVDKNGGASSSSSSAAGTTTTPSSLAEIAPGTDLVLFHNDAGTVGCSIAADSVRCDAASPTFTPTPKPADCDLDWGQSISIEGGLVDFRCVGDTTLNNDGPVLHSGEVITRGPLSCVAAANGVQCGDVAEGCVISIDGVQCDQSAVGRGFRLAPDAYELL